MNPTIGIRYTKDGVSLDVHEIARGQVYYRRWPAGITTQPAFTHLHRVPLARFRRAVRGAERTTLA